MRDDFDDHIFYLDKDEIMGIHHDIVQNDEDAESGCINEGQIDYVLDHIEHGHFNHVPKTIHEKAVSLLRLLSANHSFVDGNKRTALNSTWTFYLINGYYFDYGEEIKAILKLFAIMERMVDQDEAIDHFEGITKSLHDVEMADPLTEATALIQRIQHMIDDYRDWRDDNSRDPYMVWVFRDALNDLISDIGSFVEKYDTDVVGYFNDVLPDIVEWRDDLEQGIIAGIEEMLENMNEDELKDFANEFEENDGFRAFIEEKYL